MSESDLTAFIHRSFAKDFFSNAKIIADKFHVVRMQDTLERF